MKKSVLILLAVLTGVIFALNTGCEDDDPKEACEQDEICEGEPEVTLCCTEDVDCYWTYDGKDYADTDAGLDQLMDDLGCTTEGKSGEVNDEILARLLALRDRVIQMVKK